MKYNPRWFLVLVALLISFGTTVSAQVQIDLQPNKETENKPPRQTRWEMPEATLPCTPEVKKWWDELREAGNAVLNSRGKDKYKQKFAALLAEGLAKSFKPPIEDRKPFYLARIEAEYTEAARRNKVTGHIVARVEFRADGTVGQVRIISGLGYGLDEGALASAKKTLFLPAVQNGEFVSFTTRMEFMFDLY